MSGDFWIYVIQPVRDQGLLPVFSAGSAIGVSQLPGAEGDQKGGGQQDGKHDWQVLKVWVVAVLLVAGGPVQDSSASLSSKIP